MSRRGGGLFGPDPIGYGGEGWELVEKCERGERNTDDAFRYLLPERSREIERELREYVEGNRSKGSGYDRLLEKYENIADEIHLIRMQKLQEEREQQKKMKDYIKREEGERNQRRIPPRQSRQEQRDEATIALGCSIGVLGGLAYSYCAYQSGQYDKYQVLAATVCGPIFLSIITTGILFFVRK